VEAYIGAAMGMHGVQVPTAPPRRPRIPSKLAQLRTLDHAVIMCKNALEYTAVERTQKFSGEGA